jgi:uncharacterized membrane protein YozB (DUF420 family)
MYEIFLAVHNWLRWVVVILAVLALVRAYLGWLGGRPYTPQDRRWGSFFAISLDIQLLVGLILYFALSPLTTAALRDFGSAMRSADMRFFALEHVFYTVLAVVFAHLGTALSRRQAVDVKKHRIAAIFFTLAVLMLVIGIPWARPLFRLP